MPLEVPVPPPSFRLGRRRQRLASLNLAGELLDEFAPVGADPAPVAHQHDAAEKIPLDHKAVEPRHTLRRVDPVQHKVVLNG